MREGPHVLESRNWTLKCTSNFSTDWLFCRYCVTRLQLLRLKPFTARKWRNVALCTPCPCESSYYQHHARATLRNKAQAPEKLQICQEPLVLHCFLTEASPKPIYFCRNKTNRHPCVLHSCPRKTLQNLGDTVAGKAWKGNNVFRQHAADVA